MSDISEAQVEAPAASCLLAHNFRVTEGQRYAQCLSMQQHTMVWKVGSIVAGDPSIPHARLINVRDPLRTKTISCTTLVDRVYYQLVAESAAGTG